MNLSQFIPENLESILAEWEKFARTVPSATAMDAGALRDHAKEILLAIARDMDVEQSDEEQSIKSKGLQVSRSAEVTDATNHASVRFAEGFSLIEMASEYRALRASAVRLWLVQLETDAKGDICELTRFNEGIDQALTESIKCFSDKLDRSRELFMGMLGHDLRTPVQVILQSAQLLPKATGDLRTQVARHIDRSARNISKMVDDLLDVTRTRLGASLPLEPRPIDAAVLCRQIVEDVIAIYPRRDIEVELRGDLGGRWDAARLTQLLTNLVRNAVQHGDVASSITVRAIGEADHVAFEVHNFGEPIPSEKLPFIFEPLVRGGNGSKMPGAHSYSMGLGLYIASTIASAHSGTLSVESSREIGTLFRARLPRGPVESHTALPNLATPLQPPMHTSQ
jgi:signal transduction histidine kinase